jgi:uncharacterized protein YecT (DUF1311 family)
MRYALLILIIVSFPLSAKAKTSLQSCFANNEESIISTCLTQAYEDIESTRRIIEDDVTNMIHNDILVPPPELESSNNIEPSIHGNNVRNTSSGDHLEKALHRIREQKSQELAQRNSHKSASHLLKKRRVLDSHQASEKLFKEYRSTECEIRQLSAEKSNNLFDAIFVYKMCLHEMTQMRIEHLQKTIKP